MKCFWACSVSVVLVMSFTVASAENITHTKPLARSDLYLTCKGYQVKGASVINVEKPSYLEGTGEQVEFAIISLGDASDGLKVFFDSWGFSPFGFNTLSLFICNWFYLFDTLFLKLLSYNFLIINTLQC